ncbi:MAG: thioesterase family protein [Nocardioidaceae bacterium]
MTTVCFHGYTTAVRPEWLDYNGHMNDSAYAVVCTEANEMLLDALGLSADYQARTRQAMYTVEAHLRYLDEVGPEAQLRAESLLVDASSKRIRVHTTVLREDDQPVLTGEYLFLHVDQSVGKVVPIPPDRARAVTAMAAAHAGMPRPEHLGLGIR